MSPDVGQRILSAVSDVEYHLARIVEAYEAALAHRDQRIADLERQLTEAKARVLYQDLGGEA